MRGMGAGGWKSVECHRQRKSCELSTRQREWRIGSRIGCKSSGCAQEERRRHEKPSSRPVGLSFLSLPLRFHSLTDAGLAVPCYAIDLPARHSGIIFQFVRKHSSRKFNELGHLKRVRPIGTSASTTPNPEAQIELAGEITSTDLPPLVPTPAFEDERDSRPNASEPVNDDQDTPVKPQKPIRDGSLAADMPVSVLLFPVSSSPSDLHALLTSSPLGSALSPLPVPEPYIINVPAQPARTDKQAEEWGRVWPVTIVHIREGAKAVRRKKGWERAKLEWIEREMRGVWDKAKEAGRRGEVRVGGLTFLLLTLSAPLIDGA